MFVLVKKAYNFYNLLIEAIFVLLHALLKFMEFREQRKKSYAIEKTISFNRYYAKVQNIIGLSRQIIYISYLLKDCYSIMQFSA